MDYKMYIAGAWTDSESGKRFDVYSPATGELLGTVPEGTRTDVQRAIDAAWWDWAKRSPFERTAILEKTIDIIHRRREEMARLVTLEQGKPLVAESYSEIEEVIEYIKMSAADAVRMEGHIVPSQDANKRVLVQRVPRGVIGAISPWNWPYTMPAELIVPALAAGNAVVWACAPTTAICAVVLAECLVEAGLPSGLLNLVTGPGPVVGDEIAVNPGTHAVGFVGSVATGHTVARRAAGKDLLLELGGNGPMVIMEDANIDKAVEATLLGSYLCAGQSCTASELILVHEAVKDEYIAKLIAATEANIRLGDPMDENTTLGPMQNEKTALKMDAHIADAVAKGAKILYGGQRAENYPTQLYYQATILDGVRSDMEVSTEETFGPIVPIQTISSEAEAMAIAHASSYGLTMSVFTEDLKRGLRMAEEMRSGTVVINDSTNWYEYHIAFGGGAGTNSGFGRAGGRFGLERFTELKTIYIDLS